MQLEHFTTRDGSSSLLNRDLNETYHSTHGAITESKYVYIKMGLGLLNDMKDEIKVLEVGFGTGLNALLTAMHGQKEKLKIEYTTVEKNPLSLEIVEKLNYGEKLSKEVFELIHSVPWSSKESVNENFSIVKHNVSIEDFVTPYKYNLIYLDAFAPSKQPEIWSRQNLGKLKGMLVKGGLLVTYCAQGNFRRNLESLGFTVERLSGPPGKNEMIRATNFL